MLEVKHLHRMWIEALPAGRWVYAILLSEIAIAVYLIWGMA